MNEIVSYTLGWDTENKLGFLNATDKEGKEYILGHLSAAEFEILVKLLESKKAFIDSNKWIITGWDINN